MNKKNKSNIFNSHYINQLYIEKIYQKFLDHPTSITTYWKNIFQEDNTDTFEKSFYQEYNQNNNLQDKKNYTILKIIDFFRKNGHQYANLDPLNLNDKKKKISLSKLFKILHEQNYHSNDVKYNFINEIDSKIKNIYYKFKNIYCKSIGIEYLHIENDCERLWIQEQIENQYENFLVSNNNKKIILKQLIQSEIFEKYLHTNFPGSKRFSLEGSEILIPVLHDIIYNANIQNTKKIIIGMAHRGRLNVLVNIFKKPINQICYEFSNHYHVEYGTGDAKYHLGLRKKISIKNKNITIDLKYNPSHLEIINPVIMGAARASIERLQENNLNNILPINIHGDSAIIGQGVNQEMLNMSQTKHYSVGGILHIIINNQIGFTTSKISHLRSSRYCTDIAKMIQTPIFHVNADDPDAVIFATRIALQFKYIFKKDVFIDLIGYRRHGHNEADDPSITQPIMYQKIKQHRTVCNIYAQNLISKNIINDDYFINKQQQYRQNINELSKRPIIKKNYLNNLYTKKKKINCIKNINLKNLFIKINCIPKYFNIHNRVYKIYHDRYHLMQKNQLLDWGGAESLAYANILYHGISCRLSGEDVGRGTFFHRNAKIYDQMNGMSYIPLNFIKKQQGKFYVCDSVLSEEAVLAFEYGYSIDSYNTLNIWEAQFGDFVNGAQVIIDQFLCSGEQKWGVKSNLIMFLPHGYEGQGPEHSSARLERFLQLCSQNNIKVCIPSTASQMYHILCYQAFSNIISPLIILTPKSLLRYPTSYSYFKNIQYGKFIKVIDEIDIINLINIKKIIFCSGKIYYDLLEERRKNKNINVILIRIEQLYPFPKQELLKILNFYNYFKNILWCQEEPKNQGAWYYIYHQFKKILPKNITINYVGRPSSAATAVGCFSVHQQQKNKIIYDAIKINE